MIKKLLLFVITGAILIVLIVIAVDARRISGITLNKINNNEMNLSLVATRST